MSWCREVFFIRHFSHFVYSVLTFLLTKQSLFFFHPFYHTPLNELTNKQMMSRRKRNVFFVMVMMLIYYRKLPRRRNKSDFHYNYPSRLSCGERNTEITNFEILLVGVISSHILVISQWFDEKKTRFYRICLTTSHFFQPLNCSEWLNYIFYTRFHSTT